MVSTFPTLLRKTFYTISSIPNSPASMHMSRIVVPRDHNCQSNPHNALWCNHHYNVPWSKDIPSIHLFDKICTLLCILCNTSTPLITPRSHAQLCDSCIVCISFLKAVLIWYSNPQYSSLTHSPHSLSPHMTQDNAVFTIPTIATNFLHKQYC